MKFQDFPLKSYGKSNIAGQHTASSMFDVTCIWLRITKNNKILCRIKILRFRWPRCKLEFSITFLELFEGNSSYITWSVNWHEDYISISDNRYYAIVQMIRCGVQLVSGIHGRSTTTTSSRNTHEKFSKIVMLPQLASVWYVVSREYQFA